MTGPPGSERGTGLVATVAGFTTVLVLLLAAVEVLSGLYAQSTVGVVAQDAARSVAAGEATPAQAEHDARLLLGPQLGSAAFEWTVGPEQVALRVRAPRPRFMPGGWGTGAALGPIERTARVRTEEMR
jgi:hypothetical protein